MKKSGIRVGQASAIVALLAAIVLLAGRRIPLTQLLPSSQTVDTVLAAGAATTALLLLAVAVSLLRGSREPAYDLVHYDATANASRGAPPVVRAKRAATRVLSLATVGLASWYAYWRLTASIGGVVLWVALPLLVAELYAVIDTLLLAFMMWKPTFRVSPPPILGASVDVFVTTINEPPELVRKTVTAALAIDWKPLKVYVLDDGNRPEIERMAGELGCEVITRGAAWEGKPRHAKAGNVNNALERSAGQFVLILDADQIPSPTIVSQTIGYFRDPGVAFVQTPQHFYNLPKGDPFGSDAPLFYGPILRGKDGWNAAFFCGSNAILRRDALMQIGLIDYAAATEQTLRDGIAYLQRAIARAARRARREPERLSALTTLRRHIADAHKAHHGGESVQHVVELVDHAIAEYRRTAEADGIASLRAALSELSSDDPAADEAGRYLDAHLDDVSAITSADDWLAASAASSRAMDRDNEAYPIQPLATSSVTEDMATSVRLHSLGWKSVYHHETLAYGLAPEDLRTTLTQRSRWAEGTIQVLLRARPLSRKGLSIAQRLQYFTTIYSYFGGFASLIFLLLPVVYLFTGIAPVNAWSAEFLWHLLPYLLLSRVLFKMHALGTRVRRGEQYTLGLFPIWIRATFKAFFGKRLSFAVTPKVRQEGTHLRLIIPQILVSLASIAAIGFGLYRIVADGAQEAGVFINMFWAGYNVVLLSGIIRAAVYVPASSPAARQEFTHVISSG
jgi:cellulose synthase (UDP-forming)